MSWQKRPLGNAVKKVPHTYIDQMADRMKYLTCRHDIRFSTHPSVVMLSYIFLAQIEIQDIINIIEGIRYHWHQKKFKNFSRLLIFKKGGVMVGCTKD